MHVAVTHDSYKVVSILINDKMIEIGKEVVKAAAGNYENGKEVMMLLLEQRGADIWKPRQMTKIMQISCPAELISYRTMFLCFPNISRICVSLENFVCNFVDSLDSHQYTIGALITTFERVGYRQIFAVVLHARRVLTSGGRY